MRMFLHKLMVDITHHPREYITPKWSKSIVVNAFRVYEYWFGRRAGIRIEGSMDSKGRQLSYTWEHLFAVYEGAIRDWVTGRIPKLKIIYLPQLEVIGGMKMGVSPFRFAIAFDNAQGGGSTATLSCTVTGSNGYMFGSAVSNNTSSITATFNSIAMTSSSPITWIGTNAINGVYLASPSTGTHNFVVATNYAGNPVVNTYSGCDQGVPDQYVTQTSTGSASITCTVTTSTANCWMVMFAEGTNNTPSAGTNATGRSLNSSGNSCASSFDSNGNISTGSFAMTATGFQVNSIGAVAYKFLQATAATINSGFFMAAGAI